MRFYLASWIGDGTTDNEYRPNVGEGSWAAIDLRPDSTVQSGRVLVATPEPVASVPSGVLDIGDLADSLPRGVSRKIESDLGVTLDQFDSIQAIIAELLILHGEDLPRGVRSRWRPLKADHRGMHRIVLGGELVFEAPAVQGAVVFSDDFTGSDNDPWNASKWTTSVLQASTIDLLSNRGRTVVPSASDAIARAIASVDSDHTDGSYVGLFQPQFAAGSTSRPYFVVWLRASGDWATTTVWAPNNGYGILLESRFRVVQLYKNVSDSLTSMAESASNYLPAWTAGEEFWLKAEVDGSAVRSRFWADGAAEPGTWGVETTDTDLSGSGVLQLSFYRASGGPFDARTDDVSLDDLGAAFDPANLQATGTGTIADVVNENDNTTDLHLSVDDDPASPDDNDWVNNAVDVT